MKEKALWGDVVKDRVTGYRGTVLQTFEDCALVEIDPLYLDYGEENKWYLPYDRLIRL